MFAVELCSFAVLSNHYHLVIRLATDQAQFWTNDEVMSRWEKVYGIATPIAIGRADGASQAQRAVAEEMIDVRRQRLTNLSWFMKCLNEYVARKANLEDRCTGAFWDRFYDPGKTRIHHVHVNNRFLLLHNLAYITSM